MKRILSSILVIVLVLSLAPMTFAATAFTDVAYSAWYFEDVAYAVSNGLVNGKTSTTYEPESQLTAAEAVKLASAMHQLDEDGKVTLEAGDPWYQPYVDYAKNEKIIDKNYNWNTPITRGEYMDIFSRALPDSELTPINTVINNSIPDVDISDDYAEGIYKLYRAGVLQGSDSARNAFPDDTIKRSEVAAILTRMMDSSRRITFTLGAPETSELQFAYQPAETVNYKEGVNATVTVTPAGGTEPYSYQWQEYYVDEWRDINDGDYVIDIHYSTSKYQGTKTPSLTVSEFSADTKVRCIVTDDEGEEIISDGTVMTLIPDELTIRDYTDAGSYKSGDLLDMTIDITGGVAPYKYVLQFEQGGVYSDLIVYDNEYSTKKIYSEIVDPSGQILDMTFKWIVTDSEGTKVETAPIKHSYIRDTTEALTIVTQPVDTKRYVQEFANFSVVVTGGTAPYTYQWYLVDGKVTSPMTTQTRSVLTFAVDNTKFNNHYYCIVTDSSGNFVKTEQAELLQGNGSDIKVTKEPVSVELKAVGDDVKFSVTVSGGEAPYSYTWYQLQDLKATVIGNSSTVSVNDLDADNFKSDYYCIVADSRGHAVSTDFASITAEPMEFTRYTTGNLTFTSPFSKLSINLGVSGGVAPYTYEWLFSTETSKHNSFHDWEAELGTYYTPEQTNTSDETVMTFTADQSLYEGMSATVTCYITDAVGNTLTSKDYVVRCPIWP